MTTIWKTFWRLSFLEKWELLEASCFLAKARIEITYTSFKKLAAKLGVLDNNTPDTVSDSLMEKALRVKRAIQRTHGTVPWENVCLPQALAAMYMLRRRHVPARLYFGALTNQDKSKMKAHAWVRVGDLFVTGAKGHQKYATVAVFSNASQI